METKTYGSITITKVEDGKQLYTWTMYADDELGTNMSDDPTDKTYIGRADNQTEPTPGTDPTVYKWVLFKGEDGRGVMYTSQQYCVSDDNVDEPTSGWTDWNTALDQYMALKKENSLQTYYMWYREVTVYSSGETEYSDATVDSASSIVASWCDKSDTIQIDGSHIALGSIDAKAIDVQDLKAFGATIGEWEINDHGLVKTDDETGVEIGLAAGNGGTYTTTDGTEDNLGLVLYAGTRAEDDIKAIAGTWRFNEDISVDFDVSGRFTVDVDFSFFGWFNHTRGSSTPGWTKYEGADATLTLFAQSVSGTAYDYTEYSGSESYLKLTIGGETVTLYSLAFNRATGQREVTNDARYYLFNREIGFGPAGIDDFMPTPQYFTDKTFLQFWSEEVATFIPGSIHLYPAMIDKDGRLYVKEARIGGAVEVDACTMGNIVVMNDEMSFGAGRGQADGVFINKSFLGVGNTLYASSDESGGVSVRGLRVGSPLSVGGISDGSVTAKTVEATTSIECPTLDATTVDADTVNAATANVTQANLTNIDRVSLFHSDQEYVHCNTNLRISQQSTTTGYWQGITIDFRGATVENDHGTALLIGSSVKNFEVRSNGEVITPHSINPRFYGYFQDFSYRDFLEIKDDTGTSATVQLMGTWKDAGGSSTVTSDARAKHDIEPLDERYDVFFDNLLAQRFKYNVGTSDRYHTGYTTQGVQEALKIAEIPEQEFAGVVTFNQGTEDEESALRYYEFVSLNTDQIQKLKKRADALEAKNAELEERLAKVEALLNHNAE